MAENDPKTIILTTSQMTVLLNTSQSALSRMKNEGCPGALGRNRWDAKAVLSWWLEHVHKNGAARTDDDGTTLAEQRKRLTKLKADRQALLNAVATRKFIERDAAAKETFENARTIRDQVQAIPDRVAALVAAESDPFKCKQILKQEFDFILHGLADRFAKENRRWFITPEEKNEEGITAKTSRSPGKRIAARQSKAKKAAGDCRR